jgi:hypothetical protein
MSSANREIAYTKQGNDFFINVASVENGANFYTEAGAVASSLGTSATIIGAGGLLVKDMGKTVNVSGDQYRKVQTLAPVSGTDTTFYIKSVPASGSASLFARMTLQNA